ncbi:glycosyltransferase family 2 protein [Ensifer sp. IC3342]|nr:glycosyltransferase family 2 protein [Ensifer sp. BRP08]MCA1449240.1 glycosyltransferase family 2 protein [Ensifer sp. IC3342]
MNADVSVILPTFNRTRSLAAAMASVLSQSYENLELIVVDDGSTEDVEGVVRSFCDPRVKYVRRVKNGGAAAARNTGLAEARGNYIAFQDSDDIWLPGKLMRQISLFSTLPAHVGVVTGAKILYGRDASFNFGPAKVAFAPPPEGRLRLEEDQLGRLLSENRISLQNTLFRRDCFPGNSWFDPCARANEDWEFAIRLAQHTTLYEDIEPVVLGYISSDSISCSRHKQTMGLLRILRKNKGVLSARRKHRSRLMIDLAIALYKMGKKRRSLKFLIAGLTDHPNHLGSTVASLFRMATKLLNKRQRHLTSHMMRWRTDAR